VHLAFENKIEDKVPYIYASLRYYALRYYRENVRAHHRPFSHKLISYPDLLEIEETISACARTPLEFSILTKLMEGYTVKEIQEIEGINSRKFQTHRKLLQERYASIKS
jgi:hypothetical protein